MGIREMAAASGLKPGEQIAIASDVSGVLRIAQAFEVPSTQVQPFNPFCQPPPADVTVIDAASPAGQPVRASWPDAQARLAGRRSQPVRQLGRLASVKGDSGSGNDGD